ncbi:MAG: T9SS type A sorting domain-containing protein [Bacteroidia bacterium]
MKSLILFSLLLFLNVSVRSQTYNYYFGNLHAHTGFSDGNKDSSTSGVSQPAGSYVYAKLSQNFNFLGISEHNHYSSANNPGFQIQSYTIGLNQAAAANQEGTFLTLFGMEWGVSSTYNGHIVIYGFNQLIGWESGNYDIYNAKTDYDGIFKKVKNNPGAFCYLAHPQTSDYTTNGTAATALISMPYNSAYDSAIVGTPLRSGLAFSTFTDYSDYPSGNYFYYYKKMLSIGYHLGIGYDHDNHYTTFGRNNGGRLVIITPTLTTANLYSAMKNMHFYGSDDWNAKVSFTSGNNIMGAQLTGSVYPTFNISHIDGDGEIADSIKIWRGVSNSGGILAQPVSITKQSNTKTYTDSGLNIGTEYYYFVEIKQNDGDWIVTSPIWYKYTGAVGIEEKNKDLEFNYFPNPVSQKLYLSMAKIDAYTVSIIDITGRLVFEHLYSDNRMEIDLHQFNKGIYSLVVSNKDHSVSKRLIVE